VVGICTLYNLLETNFANKVCIKNNRAYGKISILGGLHFDSLRNLYHVARRSYRRFARRAPTKTRFRFRRALLNPLTSIF